MYQRGIALKTVGSWNLKQESRPGVISLIVFNGYLLRARQSIISYFILKTVLWSSWRYYPYFINEEVRSPKSRGRRVARPFFIHCFAVCSDRGRGRNSRDLLLGRNWRYVGGVSSRVAMHHRCPPLLCSLFKCKWPGVSMWTLSHLPDLLHVRISCRCWWLLMTLTVFPVVRKTNILRPMNSRL